MNEHNCPVHFDPLSADQLADPYPTYANLRQDCPIHYESDFDLWVASRHEDVSSIALNTSDFSSHGSVQSSTRPFPEEVQAILKNGIGEMIWMTASDDPDHKRVRSMVNRVFTARRVREMEPRIAGYVDELINSFAGEGGTDIIDSFAWPLPLWGLADILGFPRSDVPQLHEWSMDWLRLLQATEAVEQLVDYAESFVAMQRYVLDSMEARTRQPRDDLMSALVEARNDAEPPLSLTQVSWIPINLIVAGHVTVTRAIGNGLDTLFDRPTEYQAMRRASPAQMEHAVEEILRYESPAQGLFRTALRDVEVNGVTIPEGSKVMLHFGSANRDTEVFDLPSEFDPSRDDVKAHLAFGKGVHLCVGAPLARAELKHSFTGLLKRLPNLRRAGDGTRDTIFFARGWLSLPVEWDTAA